MTRRLRIGGCASDRFGGLTKTEIEREVELGRGR